MDYKWIGAVLIITGCAGFGFSLCEDHRHQEKSLRNLISLLDFMACELQYRMTPLPDLCAAVSREAAGKLATVFCSLSQTLETTAATDVSAAMEEAIAAAGILPEKTRDNLLLLGSSMGRFDLSGQLSALETVRASCRRDLERFSANRETRLRNYQTLSLCAGAALAILLI